MRPKPTLPIPPTAIRYLSLWVILAASLFTACGGEEDLEAPYNDNFCLNPLVMPLAGVGSATGLLKQLHEFNAIREAIWETPEIRVCWRDYFGPPPEKYRRLVQESVERQWNTVLNVPQIPEGKRMRFTGWKLCSEDPVAVARGVKILISDEGPHTNGVGKELSDDRHWVTLNFTFKNWSKEVCDTNDKARERCITGIAVHEFGHVLGLVHEQSRADTPDTCSARQKNERPGDFQLGRWDSKSIMNYCNPNWTDDPLSTNDKLGIVALYYAGYFPEACRTDPALKPVARQTAINLNRKIADARSKYIDPDGGRKPEPPRKAREVR